MASVAGVGTGAAMGVLVLTEAGLPIPIPGDLLMLLLGERASAGALPLWAAIVVAEAIACAGVVALYVAVRGPAAAGLHRLGARIGLTQARLDRVNASLERRGPRALALGRATPGLRTLTVLAAATLTAGARRVIPALIVGSTIFVQAHVIAGFVLGDAARSVLDRARGPIIVGVVAFALVGLVLWLARRGRDGGGQSWTEASCPACLAVGLVSAGRKPIGLR
jgi:membrane protein DedA with SNARE-associated domain